MVAQVFQSLSELEVALTLQHASCTNSNYHFFPSLLAWCWLGTTGWTTQQWHPVQLHVWFNFSLRWKVRYQRRWGRRDPLAFKKSEAWKISLRKTQLVDANWQFHYRWIQPRVYLCEGQLKLRKDPCLWQSLSPLSGSMIAVGLSWPACLSSRAKQSATQCCYLFFDQSSRCACMRDLSCFWFHYARLAISRRTMAGGVSLHDFIYA